MKFRVVRCFVLLVLALSLGTTGAWSADSFSSLANPNLDTAEPAATPAPPAAAPIASLGTVTIYPTRLAFQGAFPGLPMETFEAGNAPPGGFSVCDAPLDESGDVPCGFAPGAILAGVAFQDSPGPDAGSLILLGAGGALNPSMIVIANTFSDSFDVVFDPPIAAAGMDLHSTPGPGQGPPDTINWQVFDGADVLVDSGSATGSGPGDFWGFSSATPIARINLISTNNQAEGVDNIEFAVGVTGADLGMSKSSDAAGPVLPGDPVVFTLTVQNNGPAGATNVVVTDSLPAAFDYVSNDCGAGFVDPTLTWNVGALAAAASAICNVSVVVAANAPIGPALNTASVTATETDPGPTANSAQASVEIGGEGGPSVLEIPTLDQAGLALLLAGLAAAALMVLRRR